VVEQRRHRRVELDAGGLALPLSVHAMAEGALFFVIPAAFLEIFPGRLDWILRAAFGLPGTAQRPFRQKGFYDARRFIRAPVFPEKRNERI